mgnify:CR=1 FL=1
MQPRRLIALATCMMVACALGGGCLSEEEARRSLRKDDPRNQAAMIARIARENKTSMTGDLIRLLDAEDEGVRFMAAAALHKVTGIDRGIHFAEGEKRKAVVAEWHRWYETETGDPVPELPPEPADDEKATDEDAEGRPAEQADAKTPGEAETPGEDEPPTEEKEPAEREKKAGDAHPPGDEAPPEAPEADRDDDEPKEYPLPKVGRPDTGAPPEKAKEKGG